MYGLIGNPLGGSFSAAWFGQRGIDYRNFELSTIDELLALLTEHPDLKGFNVTSPFKEDILRYLDDIDPVAAAVGAVNCVAVCDDRCLIGYNTDAPALKEILGAGLAELYVDADGGDFASDAPRRREREYNFRRCDKKSIAELVPRVIILGTGGAAKAAAWALNELGVDFMTVSRNRPPTYSDITADIIASYRLIVNATPVGSYGLADKRPPIPYDALTSRHLLFDMVYNPAETLFLRSGRERGTHTLNGLGMLMRQAELSKEIWERCAASLGDAAATRST